MNGDKLEIAQEMSSFRALVGYGHSLGLSRMLYAEGGPEAQLYVRSGTVEHEWIGGYESTVSEDHDNRVAWPVPNVVGIARRAGAAAGVPGDRAPR